MRILLLTNDEALSSALQARLHADGHEARCLRQLPSAVNDLWGHHALLVDESLGAGTAAAAADMLQRHGTAAPMLVFGAPDAQVPAAAHADAAGGVEAVARKLVALAEQAIAAASHRQQDGDLTIDTARQVVRLNGVPVELTPMEWQVLSLLANRPERAVPRADIARLIGDGTEASDNAVAVHLYNLRRKLGRHAIETIRGRGFRLRR